MKKLLFVVALLLLPITSLAVETVSFNHLNDKSNISSINVAEGSYFEVEIKDTCADRFEVKSIGLEIYKKQSLTSKTKKAGDNDNGDFPDRNNNKKNTYTMEKYITAKSACVIGGPILIKIPHDSKYGGYRIDIVKKDKKDEPVTVIKYNDEYPADKINSELDKIYNDAENKTLTDKEIEVKQIEFIEKNISHKLSPTYFFVQVNKSPWHFDFAGGFTVSSLVNQKFGVDSSNIVYRNKSAEDLATLGFTAFLHTYNDKWKIWKISKADLTFVPVSLGLGINTGSSLSYYLGPSLKLGDAFLTVGWNLGPTQALPAGVNEGSHVTDANALSNMGTRTSGGVFFALSYTFLGSGQAVFQKPFATVAEK